MCKVNCRWPLDPWLLIWLLVRSNSTGCFIETLTSVKRFHSCHWPYICAISVMSVIPNRPGCFFRPWLLSGRSSAHMAYAPGKFHESRGLQFLRASSANDFMDEFYYGDSPPWRIDSKMGVQYSHLPKRDWLPWGMIEQVSRKIKTSADKRIILWNFHWIWFYLAQYIRSLESDVVEFGLSQRRTLHRDHCI